MCIPGTFAACFADIASTYVDSSRLPSRRESQKMIGPKPLKTAQKPPFHDKKPWASERDCLQKSAAAQLLYYSPRQDEKDDNQHPGCSGRLTIHGRGLLGQ
jgi:hypothetical protein